MALSSINEFTLITIKADGLLEVRLDRVILEDGVEITRFPKRTVYTPDTDPAILPVKVRTIANVVWTPAVVAAWIAAHPI